MAKKSKYWDINPIKKIPAQYRIIYGERSNGKTYGVLLDSIIDAYKNRTQFAYIRRWPDDIKTRKMQQLFASIVDNGEIIKHTNGEYNGIKYRFGKFYFIATTVDENGTRIEVESEEPFAFTFSISAMEHDKSIAYPRIKRIIFDEFISRVSYIPDEFSMFMNVLSSLIRDRDDIEIWMMGNTVSKDCPYFREMGLRHVIKQEPGTIDTYSYTKNGQELLIAVEYTKNLASKKSDKYFIFDNPKMEMITGGAWELAIYPHLYEKYKPNQVQFMFFINYRDTILQCEVIEGTNGIFIYCHIKTTPLQENDDDLIYSTESNANRMHRVDITRPMYPIERKLYQMIMDDRICFQDNEIGEVFNDYLKWCRSHQIIRK